MIPGFTAGAQLDVAPDNAGGAGARWATGRGPSRDIGVYAQQRMMMRADGGGQAIATASCACPCCITHGCGFLDLSTCMTCC